MKLFTILIGVLMLSILATPASAVYLNDTVCIGIGGSWSEISTGHKTCRISGETTITSDISMRNTVNKIELEIGNDGSVTINPGVAINIEEGGMFVNGNADTYSVGTIHNNGRIYIRYGGFFGSYYGAVNNNGVITNYGKFFNFATFRNDGEIYNSATFTNDIVSAESVIINSGTINNRPFGTLRNSGAVDNRPGGTINNEIGGPIKKLGKFYNGIRGGTIDNILTINNHGIINNNWVVNNEISGTIDNTADGTINNRRITNNRGTIYNCGTITGHDVRYNTVIIPVKCLEIQ
jgi:hypothetical protein